MYIIIVLTAYFVWVFWHNYSSLTFVQYGTSMESSSSAQQSMEIVRYQIKSCIYEKNQFVLFKKWSKSKQPAPVCMIWRHNVYPGNMLLEDVLGRAHSAQ